MPNVSFQRRRGTTTEHSTFTGLQGELTVDTTKETVVVHDGVTQGGYPLQKEAKQMTWAELLAIPKANIIPFSDRFFITDIGISGSEWFWDGDEFSPTAPVALNGTKLPMILPPTGTIAADGTLTFPIRGSLSHVPIGWCSSGTTITSGSIVTLLGISKTQSAVTLAASHTANTVHTLAAGTFDAGDIGKSIVINQSSVGIYINVISTTTYRTWTALPNNSSVITPISANPGSSPLTSSTSTMPGTSGQFAVTLTSTSVPATTGSITFPIIGTAGNDYTLSAGSFDPADVGKEAVATNSNGTIGYFFTILSTTKFRARFTTTATFTVTPVTAEENKYTHPTAYYNINWSKWAILDFGPNHVGHSLLVGTTGARQFSAIIMGVTSGVYNCYFSSNVTIAQLTTNGADLCCMPSFVGNTASSRHIIRNGYIWLEATGQDGNATFSGNNPLTGSAYTNGWYYYVTKGTTLNEFTVYANTYNPASLHPPRIPASPTLAVGSGLPFYQASYQSTANTSGVTFLNTDLPIGVTGEFVREIQTIYSINYNGTTLTTSKVTHGSFSSSTTHWTTNSLTGSSTGGFQDNYTPLSPIKPDGWITYSEKTQASGFTNNITHQPCFPLTAPKTTHRQAFTRQFTTDWLIVTSMQFTFIKS